MPPIGVGDDCKGFWGFWSLNVANIDPLTLSLTFNRDHSTILWKIPIYRFLRSSTDWGISCQSKPSNFKRIKTTSPEECLHSIDSARLVSLRSTLFEATGVDHVDHPWMLLKNILHLSLICRDFSRI